MDTVAIELLGTALAIKGRNSAKHGHVHDDAGHDLRDRRAARHLYHRRGAAERLDAGGTGGVGFRRLDTAIGGAGAISHHSGSIGAGLFQEMGESVAAGHAVNTVVLGAGRALHGQDILALVLLNDFIQMTLEGLAASCRKQMVVLQVNLGQHHIAGQRRRRADEGLITPRAFVAMNPDHHRKRLRFGSLHHLRYLVRGQAHQGGERHAGFQEAAAAHAFSEI